MKSPARQAIVWFLLILCTPLYTKSQTSLAKKRPASNIGGKVTIKGKGVSGIVVGLRATDSAGQQTSRYKSATDQDGNYRITNVPPGTYQVMPAAPGFVISGPGDPGVKSLIITEGETVEGIDFALTRGGVIAGRVTDSEGRPLIEEQINLLPAEANNQGGPVYMVAPRTMQTDDRGIYRIFGVPAGNYRVAVGESEEGVFAGGGSRRSQYKQTFYPAVTDPSMAGVIEVMEGSEMANVDITVGRRLDTFAVSGRIVDGESGQPLPNVRFGLQRIARERRSFSNSGSSNSQGEFKLENLAPGKYAVFIVPQPNNEIRADTVPFDLIDQDITGLLVKTSLGASVSGVIVLEGTDDKIALAKLNQLKLQIYVRNEGAASTFGQPATINQDGSFRVGGLQAGIANFSLSTIDRGQLTGFTIMRVERDGVAQLRGVEVKDREQVTGVRVVVNYGNGGIRGLVKFENGELPPNARFSVWFTSPGDDPTKLQRTFTPSPQVDSRGHFLVEGLAAGTYEVNCSVYIPGSRSRPPSTKQQVNVADGVVTEVTITLDLEPYPVPGNP